MKFIQNASFSLLLSILALNNILSMNNEGAIWAKFVNSTSSPIYLINKDTSLDAHLKPADTIERNLEAFTDNWIAGYDNKLSYKITENSLRETILEAKEKVKRFRKEGWKRADSIPGEGVTVDHPEVIIYIVASKSKLHKYTLDFKIDYNYEPKMKKSENFDEKIKEILENGLPGSFKENKHPGVQERTWEDIQKEAYTNDFKLLFNKYMLAGKQLKALLYQERFNSIINNTNKLEEASKIITEMKQNINK